MIADRRHPAMAENDWLSGYLEAILERGARDGDKDEVDLAEMKGQGGTAVRYFVNEIVGSSEEHLHRSWMKASAMKDSHDKSSRMENFSWRIWHLSRRRKHLETDLIRRKRQWQQDKEEAERDVLEEDGQEDEDGASVDEEETEHGGTVAAAAAADMAEAAASPSGIPPDAAAAASASAAAAAGFDMSLVRQSYLQSLQSMPGMEGVLAAAAAGKTKPAAAAGGQHSSSLEGSAGDVQLGISLLLLSRTFGLV